MVKALEAMVRGGRLTSVAVRKAAVAAPAQWRALREQAAADIDLTGLAMREQFLKGRFREIDGWLSADALFAIEALADQQRSDGVDGGVAEIGVHHGQLLIFLALLVEPDGHAVGYDLFDRQSENVDGSGLGDQQIVLDHAASFGLPADRFELVQTNSLDIKSGDVIADLGDPCRLFSVDGGHTPEITANDLSIASGAIAEEGVVILDDVFSPMWPGVGEGLALFMAENPDALAPFGMAGNKTFLCRPPLHSHYLAVLDGLAAHFWTRSDHYYGSSVRVLLDPV